MESSSQLIDCTYCDFKSKNQAGLINHIHRKHRIEEPSSLECWTCGKQFSKEDLLNQHYKTVLHQINCRKFLKDDMREMPPKSIENIIKEHQEKREKTCKRPYICRELEKPGTSKIQKVSQIQKT